MEEKIVLDRDSLKALSVESRLDILKLLSERNHTLTEISESLGYSSSTVKEHLDIMLRSGLITQLDTNHKWKYYKLTFKGRNIISPNEIKVVFLLAFSLLSAAVSGIFWIFNRISYSGSELFESSGADNIKSLAFETAPAAADSVAESALQHTSLFPFAIVIFIISAVTTGIAAGYLIRKKIIIIRRKK